MTGSWGYPADTAQVVVPTELLGAVSDLIADPEAFMAAIVASAGGPRLVQITEDDWVDPTQIAAVERRDDRETRIYFRGGSTVEIMLSPQDLFEKLKPQEAPHDAH